MAKGYPDYRYFSFPVSVSEGGTGTGTLTLYGVLLGNGTSQITPTAAGNPYEVLRVAALGGFPAFGAIDLSQTAATVNQLPVLRGGTGTATPTPVSGAGISITGTWPNNTITNTLPASALGDPVTVAHGGTGTATGSITGTTALTFAAGGSNQNVTLTPSGSGFTVLNGFTGVGLATPAGQLHVQSPIGGTGGGAAATVLPAGTWAGIIDQSTNSSQYNGLVVAARYHADATSIVNMGLVDANTGSFTSYFNINCTGTVSFPNTIAVSMQTLLVPAIYPSSFSITGNSIVSTDNWKSAFIGNALANPNNCGATIASYNADTTPLLSVTAGARWDANGIPTSQGTARLTVLGNGRVGIGTGIPAKILDVVGDVQVSLQLISTVATGTAPLAVTSTTAVTNLNADSVDGVHLSSALPVANGGTGTATPTPVSGAGISITGTWPNNTITNTSPASALGDPVTVAHGGTGVASWDGCRVYNSVVQSIPNTTETTILYDTERWDNGGLHSTSSNTGRLTAVKAGKYLIVLNVFFAANATGTRLLAIYHSAPLAIAACSQPGNAALPQSFSVSTIYHLAANEYVYATAQQTSGGALNLSGPPGTGPEFSMQWIGP